MARMIAVLLAMTMLLSGCVPPNTTTWRWQRVAVNPICLWHCDGWYHNNGAVTNGDATAAK